MIHLTLQQLSAFLDGELTEASTELIRRHLSECDACTLRFARIEAQEEVMVRILVDEPGDAFFVELSESIAKATTGGKSAPTAKRSEAKKTKAADRTAVTPRPKPELRPAPKPEPKPTPKPEAKPAVTSEPKPAPKPEPPPAPAPRPAIVSRPEPAPAAPARPPAPNSETRPILYGRRVEDKKRRAPGAAIAWIAAAVLCVIVMSAAWVGLHRGDGAPRAVPRPDADRAGAPVESAPLDVSAPPAVATNEPTPEPMPPVATPTPADTHAPPEAASQPVPEVALDRAPEPEPTLAPTPAPAPAAAPEKPHEKPAKPKATARADRSSEGSLRIMVPGRQEAAVTPKPTAPTPERLVERPAQNIVPVRTIITETVVSPDDRDADPPPATTAPPARTTASPARLIQEAKSASLRAAKSKDPAAFDDAASAWERAMPAIGSSPEELAMARREIAQARFQAWAESPTASRREAAVTAARAYLLYAPPGPERDQAWTWLGRLKH
ncbi:MAG TPA: zf-HC2 domain-containing protein [Candidatus Eisenbacteria bacterium]|nr:zf-HC2 domain-containing protein [Candidatus Eisenbacteria bacterium]